MKRLFSFSSLGIYPEVYLLPVYLIVLLWLLYGILRKGKGIIYKEASAVFAIIFLAVLAESLYIRHDFRFLLLKLTLLTLPLLLVWFPRNGFPHNGFPRNGFPGNAPVRHKDASGKKNIEIVSGAEGGDLPGAARQASGRNRFPAYCFFIWSGAFLLDTGRLSNGADALLWVYLYAFFPVAAAFPLWRALVTNVRKKGKGTSIGSKEDSPGNLPAASGPVFPEVPLPDSPEISPVISPAASAVFSGSDLPEASSRSSPDISSGVSPQASPEFSSEASGRPSPADFPQASSSVSRKAMPAEEPESCPPLQLLLACLFAGVLYTAINLAADIRSGDIAGGMTAGTIPGAAVLLGVQLLCMPAAWNGLFFKFFSARPGAGSHCVSEGYSSAVNDPGKRSGRSGYYSCPAEEGKSKKYYGRDGSPFGRINDLLEDGADEDAVIIRRLIHYFEKDKPFLNPDLKIGEVALQIYTNKTYLSRALNRKMAKNFNQFVNYFRIREACRMFMEHPGFRAQELCDKCGFNSISSFSTAFRINTGYSPAEWCKEVKSKLNNDEPVSLDEYFI